MDISEINNAKSLEAWLEGKPVEWAHVIATRVALRVVPLAWSVAALPENEMAKQHRENLVLLTFRACFISFAVCKNTANDMTTAAQEATKAISIANNLGYISKLTKSVDASTNVAHRVAKMVTKDAAKNFSYSAVVTIAADAASAAGSVAVVDMDRDYYVSFVWDSIKADCSRLEKVNSAFEFGFSELGTSDHQNAAKVLMQEPLWPEEVWPYELPNWAGEAFSKFGGSDLVNETSFGLVMDWYHSVLQGKKAFLTSSEIKIVQMADKHWQGDPVEVMDQVAELAGWSRDVKRGGDFYFEAEKPKTSSNENGQSFFSKETVQKSLGENRKSLMLTSHSILLQIQEYKEKVRGNNSLDLEFKDGLMDFLSGIEFDIAEIIKFIPNKNEQPSDKDAEVATTKLNRFTNRFQENLPRYFEPEHLADISPPISVIFGCGSIGAILGGPVGFGIGAFVGKLITNEAKPGQSSEKVKEMFEDDAPTAS